jgi:hypothetical protein
MERWAEAISGEFNSKETANTVRVFATMGTKPRERMMGQETKCHVRVSKKSCKQGNHLILWGV